MHDLWKKAIDELDGCSGPCTEMSVISAIDPGLKHYKDNGLQIPEELLAEWIAFSVMPDYEGGEGPWGTYFGPAMVFEREGKLINVPSIEQITSSMIEYWERRVLEAKHPMLRCRYANLVWEFKPKIIKIRAKVDFAWIVIDTCIQILTTGVIEEGYVVEQQLKRALSLSLSLKDKNRIAKVKEAILKLPLILKDPLEQIRATVSCFVQLVGKKRFPSIRMRRQASSTSLRRY